MFREGTKWFPVPTASERPKGARRTGRSFIHEQVFAGLQDREEQGVRELLRKHSCEPGCLRERLRGDWGAPAPAPGRLSLWMGWELVFGGAW